MAKGPAGIFRRIIQLVVDSESVRKAKAALQDALNKGTDATGLKRNLTAVDRALNKLKIGAIALGTALAGALVLGMRKVLGESIEMQKILAQQEAVLKSTGEAAGRNAKQLQEQANALQKLTTFTDDQVTAAQNLLLTFRHLREEEFDKAVEVTLDLATAMGTDASSAALQLGKALEDPIAGLTALRRSGVSFSQSQRDVIKQLVETGRTAEAQRLILAELEVQFGGSAEAARDTLGGALTGLSNAWDDLFEVSRESSDGIIRAINGIAAALPVLDSLLDKLFRAGAAVTGLFGSREEQSFSTRLRRLTGVGPDGRGGVGDVRRAEGDDAVQDKQKLAAATRDAAEAEEARLAAAKAAAEAAAKEGEERRKAQEAQIRALRDLHELGVASVDDTLALIQAQASLKTALQQANVTLEERARLWGMIQDIQDTLNETRFAVAERTPPGEIPPRFGISVTDPDNIVATAATEAASATESAWLEAFENIATEGEALAMVLGEVMAGTGEGFLSIIARIAPAKAKENFVRAIEAAGAGLARLVLYGDAGAAAAGAKAAALHTAAGIGWQTLGGGGGGGGGGAGSFASGAGGVGTVGRSADRTQQQTHTTVYVNVDPFDPKNGVHQQKVGHAVVYWQQRQSPNGRPRA